MILRHDIDITCGSLNQENFFYVVWIVMVAEALLLGSFLFRAHLLKKRWERAELAKQQHVSPEVDDKKEEGKKARRATILQRDWASTTHITTSGDSVDAGCGPSFLSAPAISGRKLSSRNLALVVDLSPPENLSAPTPLPRPKSTENPPQLTLIFPIHFRLLFLAVLAVLARAIVFRFVSVNTVAWGIVELSIMNGLVAAVRESIAIFLCQNSAGKDAVHRTVCFASLWGLAIAATAALVFSEFVNSSDYSNNETYLNAPLELWTGMDIAFLSFHALCWIYWMRPSNDRGRTSGTWIFSAFLCSIYTAFLVSDFLLLSKRTENGCISLVAQAVYYSCWPLVAYLVLRLDANYWRSMGARPSTGRKQARVPAGQSNEAVISHLEPLLMSSSSRIGSQTNNVKFFDFSHIETIDCVGVGATANVFTARLLGHKEIVAVKRFELTSLTRKVVESYVREVAFSNSLVHPNIVELIGLSVQVPRLSLIMEYCSNGTLMDFLKKLRRAHDKRIGGDGADPTSTRLNIDFLDHRVRLDFAFDVSSAIQFLHHRDVLHLDLKSLNFLVTGDYILKLSDFGESRMVHADGFVTNSASKGTPHWLAPECFDSSNHYSVRSDVYSMGVIFWELITGCPPYKDMDVYKLIASQIRGNLSLVFPDATPMPFRQLTEKMLARNAADRPDSDSVMEEIEKQMKQ